MATPRGIVVVGHGRSPEGRNWGKEIDRARTVIRMWDWHWQGAEDYGSRYDLGVFTILEVSMRAFLAANRREPAEGWIAYQREVSKTLLPDRTFVAGQQYRDRIGGAGINLTRGCAAACVAIDKLADQDESVILVGFDNMKARYCLPISAAFPPAYRDHYDMIHPQWRRRWYSPGSQRCGSHDIAAESGLLAALAVERSVDLRFAEDIWC